MKLYRFWVKCTRLSPQKYDENTPCFFIAYGYSNKSEDDARRCGEKLLDAICRKTKGERNPWEYSADGRPIREETLRVLNDGNVVTRNRYGAEVLNSTTHFFIDIDGEIHFEGSFFGFLSNLFSSPKSSYDDIEALTSVKKLADKAGLAGKEIRVYRTKAGFRLILRPERPTRELRKKLMAAFYADDLYADLCEIQDCCRARLTPKPHRIHLPKCHFNFPETDAAVIERQSQWLENYGSKSSQYATCRYIGTVYGPDGVSNDDIIRFHDDRSKAMSKLPLA